ncbi:MAG: hypothetical protein Q9168_006548, partial [Polycauliona sp. 1 TL-2023]
MYISSNLAFATVTFLSNTYSTSAQAVISDSDLGNNTSCQVDTNRATPQIIGNATGSVSRPGYVPPKSDSRIPAGNWTWSTAINVYKNIPWQSFALDTATLRGIPQKQIPFSVCINLFPDIPREKYIINGQRPAEGNGKMESDCTSILSRECIDKLVSLAQDGGRDASKCDNLDQIHPPAECGDVFEFSNTNLNLFDKDSGTSVTVSTSNSTDDDTTSNTNTNTNTNTNDKDSADLPTCGGEQNDDTINRFSGFAIGRSPALRSDKLNETDYDEAIYRVVPFLTTIIAENEEAQTSLVCLRASDIANGSRVPPEIPMAPAPAVLDGSKPQAGKGSDGEGDGVSGASA